MPSPFCDESPCDLLRQAFLHLVPDNREPRSVQLDVVARVRDPKKPFFRVTLRYCPFCGTRFDEKGGEVLLSALDRQEARLRRRGQP